MILLGSEVIIVPIDDARRLVEALLKTSRAPELQRLGILSVLDALRDAIKRHDYDVEDNQ